MRDAEGRFALGGKLAGWAAAAEHGLIARAAPMLAALVEQTGESAQLYVREGDRRVCVAVTNGRAVCATRCPLGAVLPLSRGSGGKVLLAWAADAAEFDVDAKTLAAVRRRGLGGEHRRARIGGGERERARAATRASAVVAAISVSGPDRPPRRPSRAAPGRRSPGGGGPNSALRPSPRSNRGETKAPYRHDS